MEIKINVEDYLDREEIKELISYEISKSAKNDAERILSNTAYGVVFEAVDKALDSSMQEIITQKVLKIIDGLSEFCVFRDLDVSYGRQEASLGYKMINSALTENKKLLDDKVYNLLTGYDIDNRIKNRIEDSLEDIILDVLKKGLTKEN